MQTYKAYFHTDADDAAREFAAGTPEEALALARRFHDDDPSDLMFESYDGGMPVIEISIHDADSNRLAVWYDDDMRLRLAGRRPIGGRPLGAWRPRRGGARTIRRHRQVEGRRRMSSTIRVPCRPSLDLGQVVAMPGALAATANGQRLRYLARHSIGDWGRVCREDRDTNGKAVPNGSRILSARPIDAAKPCSGFGGNTLWIITEGDRSVTTLLLPGE